MVLQLIFAIAAERTTYGLALVLLTRVELMLFRMAFKVGIATEACIAYVAHWAGTIGADFFDSPCGSR